MRGLICCVALAALAAGAAVARADDPSSCAVVTSNSGVVAAVHDERTLRLADGRVMRLAGLASLADAGEPAIAEANAGRARAELSRLAQGKALALQDLDEDRYGRRIVLASAAGAPAGPTLQERLIAAGHGLVAGRIGHPGCASRFLGAERTARAARLGLWADPRYVIREAGAHTAIAALHGRFILVEGAVRSVNDRGATVYVNFGGRWSEDFTVTIAKRNMRSFEAAGIELQALAGRRVRIRGWVDARGGPWIEATGPAQIEFAELNRD